MNYPAPKGGVSLRASSFGGFPACNASRSDAGRHPRLKGRGIPAAEINSKLVLLNIKHRGRGDR